MKKSSEKMKGETAGVFIKKFMGLRWKLYGYIHGNQKETTKAKGVKKNLIKNELHHQHYQDVLIYNIQNYSTMKVLRRKNHNVTC